MTNWEKRYIIYNKFRAMGLTREQSFAVVDMFRKQKLV